jgi:hypothetical protein
LLVQLVLAAAAALLPMQAPALQELRVRNGTPLTDLVEAVVDREVL